MEELVEGVDVCLRCGEETQSVPNATCHLLRRRGYGSQYKNTATQRGRACCGVCRLLQSQHSLSLCVDRLLINNHFRLHLCTCDVLFGLGV